MALTPRKAARTGEYPSLPDRFAETASAATRAGGRMQQQRGANACRGIFRTSWFTCEPNIQNLASKKRCNWRQTAPATRLWGIQWPCLSSGGSGTGSAPTMKRIWSTPIDSPLSPSSCICPGVPEPGSFRGSPVHGLSLGGTRLDSDLQAWQRVGGPIGRCRGAVRECAGKRIWDQMWGCRVITRYFPAISKDLVPRRGLEPPRPYGH